MTRTRTLAISATLTAAAAIGAFFATGVMPDAAPGATCTVSWAAGPCEAAVALSAGDVVCEPGTIVTLPVEIATAEHELDDGAVELPTSFVPIESTTRAVPCETFTRPGKALTVVPLAKHGQRLGGRWTLEGTFIEGAGPYCPPIVVAGLVPPGCE